MEEGGKEGRRGWKIVRNWGSYCTVGWWKVPRAGEDRQGCGMGRRAAQAGGKPGFSPQEVREEAEWRLAHPLPPLEES